MSKSPITTHILDTAVGRPAAGVRVVLDKQEAEAFVCIGEGVTDADGRIADLLEPGTLRAGVHRLTFHVGDYLSDSGRQGFYPQVPVIFEITATCREDRLGVLEMSETLSEEGIKLTQNRRYELIAEYNNTTAEPIDAMGILYVYLKDNPVARK